MKAEYDFSKGKRGAVVTNNKTKITIRLDDDVVEYFKQQAEAMQGGNYQSNINEALKEHIQGVRLEQLVRKAVKEAVHDEMKAAA
jgi:uncharacterized protein (DUF4415 family)